MTPARSPPSWTSRSASPPTSSASATTTCAGWPRRGRPRRTARATRRRHRSADPRRTGSRSPTTCWATGPPSRWTASAAPTTYNGHTLRSVSGPGGTEEFTCDEAGNTTNRKGHELKWDAEGRLAQDIAAGGTTEFVHDANGARLIRRDPTGATLYLGGQELRVDKATGAKTATRYYTHAGVTVAMRDASGLTWLAGDHHGTQQIAIDSDTLEVARRRQTPFGGARGPAVAFPGEKGFVGTVDAAAEFVTLGARQYDPAIGRFLSVDPVLDLSSPQQMHGYTYSNNNPMTLSDPSGLRPEDEPGYCLGYVGDCGIDPTVGGDVVGKYTPEQLASKGVLRSQTGRQDARTPKYTINGYQVPGEAGKNYDLERMRQGALRNRPAGNSPVLNDFDELWRTIFALRATCGDLLDDEQNPGCDQQTYRDLEAEEYIAGEAASNQAQAGMSPDDAIITAIGAAAFHGMMPRVGGGGGSDDGAARGDWNNGQFRRIYQSPGGRVLVLANTEISVDKATGARTMTLKQLNVYGEAGARPGAGMVLRGMKEIAAEARVVHNVQFVRFEGVRTHTGRPQATTWDVRGNVPSRLGRR